MNIRPGNTYTITNGETFVFHVSRITYFGMLVGWRKWFGPVTWSFYSLVPSGKMTAWMIETEDFFPGIEALMPNRRDGNDNMRAALGKINLVLDQEEPLAPIEISDSIRDLMMAKSFLSCSLKRFQILFHVENCRPEKNDLESLTI